MTRNLMTAGVMALVALGAYADSAPHSAALGCSKAEKGELAGVRMTLEIGGGRVAAVELALAVLRKCRKEASDRHKVHGFRVPFYAPGGAYGDNWWQLDHSVAVQGANWFDSADAARALDGSARRPSPGTIRASRSRAGNVTWAMPVGTAWSGR